MQFLRGPYLITQNETLKIQFEGSVSILKLNFVSSSKTYHFWSKSLVDGYIKIRMVHRRQTKKQVSDHLREFIPYQIISKLILFPSYISKLILFPSYVSKFTILYIMAHIMTQLPFTQWLRYDYVIYNWLRYHYVIVAMFSVEVACGSTNNK